MISSAYLKLWYFSWKSWFQLVIHPPGLSHYVLSIEVKMSSDNMQPWHTPFPILNQSVVACKFLYPCSHFLSVCASFGLKSIFCRPHISGSCVIIQSVILSLLIKAFSLLTSFCNGHLFCFYHHMMLHAHLVFSLPLPLNQPLFQGTLVGSFYRRMNFRNQGS